MSYELYFKRGWSNKDAGLKRSREIHCHKKATWLAFGTRNYSVPVDIQILTEAPLLNNAVFSPLKLLFSNIFRVLKNIRFVPLF